MNGHIVMWESKLLILDETMLEENAQRAFAPQNTATPNLTQCPTGHAPSLVPISSFARESRQFTMPLREPYSQHGVQAPEHIPLHRKCTVSMETLEAPYHLCEDIPQLPTLNPTGEPKQYILPLSAPYRVREEHIPQLPLVSSLKGKPIQSILPFSAPYRVSEEHMTQLHPVSSPTREPIQSILPFSVPYRVREEHIPQLPSVSSPTGEAIQSILEFNEPYHTRDVYNPRTLPAASPTGEQRQIRLPLSTPYCLRNIHGQGLSPASSAVEKPSPSLMPFSEGYRLHETEDPPLLSPSTPGVPRQYLSPYGAHLDLRDGVQSQQPCQTWDPPPPIVEDNSQLDRSFPFWSIRQKQLPAVSSGQICNFCKKNGELKRVYQSHKLMERGRITCPVLRMYVCPQCGATGDNAHTVSYCPSSSGETKVMLSRTPRKSCGCKRVCRHNFQRHH